MITHQSSPQDNQQPTGVILRLQSKPHKTSHIFLFTLSILSLFLGLAVLYFGITATINAIEKFGPAIFWNVGKGYILSAILSGLLFIILFVLSIPKQDLRIDVYEDRFVLYKGKQADQWYWPSIDKIKTKVARHRFLNKEVRRSYKVMISRNDDMQLKLNDSLENIDNFIQILRDRTYSNLLKRAQYAFNAGEYINFGHLRIHQQQGLLIGRKRISWEHIERIDIKKGLITFKLRKQKHAYRLPLHQLENIDILLTLIETRKRISQSDR